MYQNITVFLTASFSRVLLHPMFFSEPCVVNVLSFSLKQSKRAKLTYVWSVSNYPPKAMASVISAPSKLLQIIIPRPIGSNLRYGRAKVDIRLAEKGKSCNNPCHKKIGTRGAKV